MRQQREPLVQSTQFTHRHSRQRVPRTKGATMLLPNLDGNSESISVLHRGRHLFVLFDSQPLFTKESFVRFRVFSTSLYASTYSICVSIPRLYQPHLLSPTQQIIALHSILLSPHLCRVYLFDYIGDCCVWGLLYCMWSCWFGQASKERATSKILYTQRQNLYLFRACF